MISIVSKMWRSAWAPFPCPYTYVRLEGFGVVEVRWVVSNEGRGVERLLALLFGWPSDWSVGVRPVGEPPSREPLPMHFHDFMERQRPLSAADLADLKESP